MREQKKNVGSILEGLNNSKMSQYGRLVNEEEYKTIAGIRAKVDKDGKVIDEGTAPLFKDVSNFKVFKLDKDNACVIFEYNGKNYIQGVQNGDEEVNLEVEDEKSLNTYIERLKEAGFKEESVSKEDLQKEFDKITEEYIVEKPGDRKAFSKHEARVGTHIRKGNTKIAGYSVPNFVTDKEANDTNKKLGTKLGGKLVKTAAKGAIIKFGASKGILTGLIAAGATGSKSVAGAALAVKVCTAIPMAGFGGLALAGVGVAAGATIAHKAVKKSIEKAEQNVNRGYKAAWGKYYKKDGKEWVQITKDEYYKLKEKDEPKESKIIENSVRKVIEACNEDKELLDKEDLLNTVGVTPNKSKKVDVKNFGKVILKAAGKGVNEDKWITIKGTHTLIDDKGTIQNKNLKDKIEKSNKKDNLSGNSMKLDSNRMKKRKDTLKSDLSSALKSGDAKKAQKVVLDAIVDVDNELLDEIKDDEYIVRLTKSNDVIGGLSEMADSDELDDISSDDLKSAMKDMGISLSDEQSKKIHKCLKDIRDNKKALLDLEEPNYDEEAEDKDKEIKAMCDYSCKMVDYTANIRRAQFEATVEIGSALKPLFGFS